MINIYGSIGYTILKHSNYNKIIVFADMHDTLKSCENKINISSWMLTKFKSSSILLEEVPREDVELKELWTNAEHTQELKNLYLQYPNNIKPIDIRPFLIPFSYEILNEVSGKLYDITLKEYLTDINDFFNFKNKYLLKNLSNYNLDKLLNTKLGHHFIKIKKTYLNLLIDIHNKINNKIRDLYKLNYKYLNNISMLLNFIMEWYICANIDLLKEKPIIVHAGLFHSENIITLLSKFYNYSIVYNMGKNKLMDNKEEQGCINLPLNYNALF